MSEEGDYQVHGIAGNNSVFHVNFCPTDRTWRKQLLLAADRYSKTRGETWDECNNAFVKPKPPQFISILDNLHKRSDFE